MGKGDNLTRAPLNATEAPGIPGASRQFYALEWELGKSVPNRCTLHRFARRADRDRFVAGGGANPNARGYVEAVRIRDYPAYRARVARHPRWWIECGEPGHQQYRL